MNLMAPDLIRKRHRHYTPTSLARRTRHVLAPVIVYDRTQPILQSTGVSPITSGSNLPPYGPLWEM